MSERKPEINCKSCNKRVPLGKLCLECGEKIGTESSDGSTSDEPRPPIQASDAASSELNTKVSSQQTKDTSTIISDQSVAITGNSDKLTHQKDVSTVSSSTVTLPLYSDALKSLPPRQNQQSNLPGNIATESPTGVHSDASREARGQPNTSERSNHSQDDASQIDRSTRKPAENEPNRSLEVCVYHMIRCYC